MPSKRTVQRARQAKRAGKAPTTQAGEFVHEEIEHVRKGKHGARSAKQAIAIGLSKARRSGVKVPASNKGSASAKTRKSAARGAKAGKRRASATTRTGATTKSRRPSALRSKASLAALAREPRTTVTRKALSRQARKAARKRR